MLRKLFDPYEYLDLELQSVHVELHDGTRFSPAEMLLINMDEHEIKHYSAKVKGSISDVDRFKDIYVQACQMASLASFM